MATFEIQAPNGKKYRVEGETQEGALAALKKMLGPSQGSLDMTAKSEAAIQQAKLAGGSPGLASFAQGALMNFGDEMIGGIEALKGGDYTQSRDRARQFVNAAEAESGVLPNILGQVTTGVLGGAASGAKTLWQILGLGAAEGGLSSYGATEKTGAGAATDTAIGAVAGTAGAGLGFGLGKVIEKFMARGLAFNTIKEAMAGKVDDLVQRVRQLGGSPAEVDEVVREVLRQQASKNSTAAVAALDPARQRLSDVNAQVVDDINRLISPENVAAFTKRTQAETRAIAQPGYQAVAQNPAQIGLTPELAGMPGVDDALNAAKEMAAFEKRAFDPNALTVQDLDVMQRYLRIAKEKAFQGTPLETLKGPSYGTARTEINELAKQASPELAQSQAAVALQKSVEEATELGKAALNPSKEAIEVAEEFAALAPEAQAGYRAAFASRLRAQLATTKGAKGTKANISTVLDKPGVVEKMKALGFPAEEIDAIIERGAGARGVLDALIGGSQTARLTAAQKASQSPLSKLSGTDLMAGGIVHPGAVVALPASRAAGSAQERAAAEMLIKALTSQDPSLLSAILNRAPQRATPLLGILGAAGGASQTGQLQ
jgi:hypothetical protein